MLPGTASLRRSSGRAREKHQHEPICLPHQEEIVLTGIGHKGVFLTAIVGAPEPFNKFLVLVLQLLLVRIPHLVDLVLQILRTPGGFPQRVLSDVCAQRLNAHIVDVVGFVENDDAVLGEIFGNALGNLGVEKVVVRVDDDVAVLHL